MWKNRHVLKYVLDIKLHFIIINEFMTRNIAACITETVLIIHIIICFIADVLFGIVHGTMPDTYMLCLYIYKLPYVISKIQWSFLNLSGFKAVNLK